MVLDAEGQARLFLSTLPAAASDRRQTGAAIAVFLLVFTAIAPFAKIQLPEIWAFIPSYQSALVVNYLLTALMAVSHTLSFPGVVAPEELIGGGPQTTAWLYMAWHAGFPLAVIAYARTGRSGRSMSHPRAAIAAGAAGVVAVACALTLLATVGHDLLPPLMAGNGFTATQRVVMAAIW